MNRTFDAEQIENINNCVLLKKQFAYELYKLTPYKGHNHETAFEAAKELAKQLYPFSCTTRAASYIATKWVDDEIVIETYLQIREGEAQGILYPNKSQYVMSVMSMLDELDNQIKNYNGSKQSKKYKQLKSLRVNVLETSKLLHDVMEWNF